MHYILSKQFEKSFAKLPRKIKIKAIEQLKFFIVDPMDARLGNHSLSGKWRNHRSIDITGDIRALYVKVDDKVVRFVDIGSHSELYS